MEEQTRNPNTEKVWKEPEEVFRSFYLGRSGSCICKSRMGRRGVQTGGGIPRFGLVPPDSSCLVLFSGKEKAHKHKQFFR